MSSLDVESLKARTLELKAKKRSWGEIALLILRAEETGVWKLQDSLTFSDWLESLAEQLGLQRSNLWRYRSSAYFAIDLMQLSRSLSDSELIAALNRTSAENLELLSKISRVAPDGVFRQIKDQVLTGELTRKRLRETWELFKPALGGETAQGRSRPPVVEDPDSQASVQHAIVLSQLAENGAKWLSPMGVISSKLMGLSSNAGDQSASGLDAVIVARMEGGAEALLHGVKVIDSLEGLEQFASLLRHCEHLWLAISKRNQVPDNINIPEQVGLVAVSEAGVEVIAQGQTMHGSDTLTRMCKHLLARML